MIVSFPYRLQKFPLFLSSSYRLQKFADTDRLRVNRRPIRKDFFLGRYDFVPIVFTSSSCKRGLKVPGYRPISSQTCCTVATAPGAALVGRKQLSSANWMAFWLTSVVHRERFLLNGVFVQRFQAPSGQAFFSGRVSAVEKDFCSSSWIEPSRFFTGFGDRRVDMNDMTYGSPTTTTTSTLDRDELGAALLFWNSSSDKCFCEHADRC